jgi:[ribosomal protein S18]-alanine N-acetyltransferase
MTLSQGKPTLLIRPLQATDIEAVAQIDRQSFATPWSTQAYLNELSNNIAQMFVAVDQGIIVGYIGIQVVMDEGHVTTVAVAPLYRGKKIGEHLLIAALEAAIKMGAEHMTLEVRRSNTAAQSLYQKYGFVSVAQRKGYYADVGEDADILWANNLLSDEWQQLFQSAKATLITQKEKESL